MKIKGKVLVRGQVDPEVVLNLEQWLNKYIAADAFEKFGVGLRFHLEEEQPCT